jgi:hypothetical protein
MPPLKKALNKRREMGVVDVALLVPYDFNAWGECNEAEEGQKLDAIGPPFRYRRYSDLDFEVFETAQWVFPARLKGAQETV